MDVIFIFAKELFRLNYIYAIVTKKVM